MDINAFLFTLILFIFGACVGSFLNVLIYRLPDNLTIFGRSFCPHCKKQIAWQHNIPLVSFILLGGRCKYCHSPISWQYPVVELVTGILFVSVAVQKNLGPQKVAILDSIDTIYLLFILSCLIVIFFTDLLYEIIPDEIVFSASFVSAFYIFIAQNSLFVNHLISALGASLAFLILIFITKGRGMGLGDVKLAFLMGISLGWPKIIIAIYLALLTGAALSVLLIIMGKKTIKSTIPFGPFLAGNTILTFFYGNSLSIYMQKIMGF